VSLAGISRGLSCLAFEFTAQSRVQWFTVIGLLGLNIHRLDAVFPHCSGRYNMSSTNYKIVGRLDNSSAAVHRVVIQELLAGETVSVSVDLSELDYVSSAGLQVLLLAAKAAKAKGGGLVLLSPKPHILEVLKLTGFGKPPVSIVES
jgi:anti-anti-sigma factor